LGREADQVSDGPERKFARRRRQSARRRSGSQACCAARQLQPDVAAVDDESVAACRGRACHRCQSEAAPEQRVGWVGDCYLLRPTGCQTNRGIKVWARSNFSTNTPTDEGDVPALASVTVEDPRHPLFGRSFRVLGFAPPSTVGLSPSYEVKYLHGISLLVPVAATVRPDRLEKRTKLSVEALRDLISLIELLDAHDDRAERPLVDTSRGAAAADHRPDCRRADGDAP
jgi:hypothetical protein